MAKVGASYQAAPYFESWHFSDSSKDIGLPENNMKLVVSGRAAVIAEGVACSPTETQVPGSIPGSIPGLIPGINRIFFILQIEFSTSVLCGTYLSSHVSFLSYFIYLSFPVQFPSLTIIFSLPYYSLELLTSCTKLTNGPNVITSILFSVGTQLSGRNWCCLVHLVVSPTV